MSFKYGMNSIPRNSDDDDEYSRLEMCLSKQSEFLAMCCSTDLLEIRSVACFLGLLGVWAIGIDGSCIRSLEVYDFGGLYLFAGPRAILECYEGRTIEPLQIPSYVLDVAYEGFLLKPLNKILKDRNPFFPHGHSFRHSILDRIIGENDPCQHCGSPTAQLDLYNKTNWDFPEGLLKLDFHMYFKGNLWTNRAEGIGGCLQAVDFPTIMGEMVDNNQNSNWTKEGWACHLCLSTFFTDMLPAWWLERKKKAGITIMKDCPNRYGYDCDEQMWDTGLNQAENFNHLCEPTQRKTRIW